MTKRKLRPKQKLFIQEYLVDKNATQAAIRAGYSEKTAKETGYENLTKPHIAELINVELEARIERVKYTADEVLADLKAIVKFDFRVLYDEDGDLLPPAKWPDEAVIAIQAVDVQSVRTGSSDDEPLSLWTKRMRMESKLKAIELAGKHVDVRAFDNTIILDIPPKVYRNFTGRKDAGLE